MYSVVHVCGLNVCVCIHAFAKMSILCECMPNTTLGNNVMLSSYTIETSTSTSLITPPTNAINISSHDAPITARYSTVTRDIEHALRQSPSVGNRGEMRSKSSISIIYGLAGTVLQVDGLKGDLSKLLLLLLPWLPHCIYN